MPEPFEEGYKAGIRGDDPRMCPYEKMSKEWNEYQRGLKIGAAIVDVDTHLAQADR